MNPFAMTQDQLFEKGCELVKQFLKYNGLGIPAFTNGPLPTARAPRGTYGCGHYLARPAPSGTIWVNPAACAKPSKGNGRQRSFPGYSTDRTPIGVVSHEAGHAVDSFLRCSDDPMWRVFCEKSKDRISSYEPNPSEAFAESMRIFILNPALLQLLSPNRYAYLNDVVKKTVLTDDPRYVLKMYSAPATYLATVERRMLRS